MSKRLPRPGVLSTAIAPPCAETMPCTTASPSPVPCPTGLVVKNGSKTRSRVASSMPQPLSLTHRCACAPGAQTDAGRAASGVEIGRGQADHDAAAAALQRVPGVGAQVHQHLLHLRRVDAARAPAHRRSAARARPAPAGSSAAASASPRPAAATAAFSSVCGCWRLNARICCTRLRARIAGLGDLLDPAARRMAGAEVLLRQRDVAEDRRRGCC